MKRVECTYVSLLPQSAQQPNLLLTLAASTSTHRHSTNPIVDEACVQTKCCRAKALSEAEVGIDFSQKQKHEVSKATMGLIQTHTHHLAQIAGDCACIVLCSVEAKGETRTKHC